MYTSAQLIQLFKDYSGERGATPTSDTIMTYINLAYTGLDSILPDLFPRLAVFLGTAATALTQNFTANTSEHAITNAETIRKLGHVGLRYDSAAEYRWIPDREILDRPITDEEKTADHATVEEPLVAFYDGTLYTWPECGTTVTDGIKLLVLVDPTAATVGGSGLVVQNPVAQLIVRNAIVHYRESLKRYDLMQLAEARYEKDKAKLLSYAPGRPAAPRLTRGRGNLTGLFR